LLPDSIIDKHESAARGGESDTGADDDLDPDSADDLDLGDDLDEPDTRESDSDTDEDLDEDEDSGDDDAGDDAEDDEETDEGEEDDDLDEDDLEESDTAGKPRSLLKDAPEFDRRKLDKQIKDNPELGKAYKSLQRAATQRFEEAADIRKAGERALQERDAFVQQVQTRDGALKFLRAVVLENREVVAEAFDQVLQGADAEDLLVEIALAKPEIFEKARTRIEEMEEDPREKQRFQRDRESKKNHSKSTRERETLEAQRRQVRSGEIRKEITEWAKKAGMADEDVGEITVRVRERIQANGKKPGGNFDVTSAEIKEAVIEARKVVREREARVAARLAARQRKDKRKQVRDRMRGSARRPRPARGAGSSAVRRRSPAVPAGRDPLDFAVETAASRARD